MIIKNSSILICAFTTFILVTPVLASDSGEVIKRTWYLGAGLGISELDPDTSNTGYSVTEQRDTGFKLFGGFDYSDHFTIEGFYTDLGAAEIGGHVIKPDGQIDYSTLGVSALWYFWRNNNNEGENHRRGLQAYVHGGLSFLSNTASVDYSQDNDVQVQYGAGVEYGLKNDVALRAGFDLYDKDAGMVFVGVLKRFGVKKHSKIAIEPVKEEPVIVAEAVIVDTDADKDGVVDSLDECAETPVGTRVDEKGCRILKIELKAVNFEPQSFDLTQESKAILDEAAIRINANLEIKKIEVQAHTDNKGSEKYNLKLSEQRAASVKAYLVSQGVNEKRLLAKGYGESQPVADNETEDGRAQNRRVELVVINDEDTAEETPADEEKPSKSEAQQ